MCVSDRQRCLASTTALRGAHCVGSRKNFDELKLTGDAVEYSALGLASLVPLQQLEHDRFALPVAFEPSPDSERRLEIYLKVGLDHCTRRDFNGVRRGAFT